jgi:voltage-gated potassium channel
MPGMNRETSHRDLLKVVGFLAALVATGAVGYRVIEGWSWFECVYMTIITIATVGFREVHALSDIGRLFTVLLIVGGVSIVGYGATLMTSFVVEGRINEAFRGRRLGRIMENMKEHYIVCGYGRIGSVVAEELVTCGRPIVIVDTEEHPGGIRINDVEVPLIVGDATEEETLLRAGIERASGLVAALPGDADNVMATLVARDLNMDIYVVARAVVESSVSKLHRAGATKVVAPYELGARRMASLLLRPLVLDFLDVMMHGGDVEIRLEQVTISQKSPMSGKTIRDASIGALTGAIVLAVKTLDGKTITNPSGDYTLNAWEQVIVMGSPEQLAKLRDMTEA